MTITRRAVVRGLGIGMSMPFMARPAMSQAAGLMARSIPKTGEALPLVGLGTWITFNVGDDSVLMDECAAVIAAFFEGGGRMIDCSPMYGSSQPTIGHGLARIGYPERLFSAEKVWISDTSGGAAQIEASREHWGVARFDLMQVHNLVSWDEHLPALFSMKASGRLRYVGITTSEGRRHREIEQVMASEPIDFVQITYNILDRAVEERILPLAQEKRVAVIVNRPFRQGDLIRRFEDAPLPDWVAETGARSWAQFLLKFIISHPAVTCAIPATTRVDHVRENLEAARGILPDEKLRKRMTAYVEAL
ncbi:aldo/keto reductase [Sinorhizobium medicae]|uniref:Aldo/keto reductase n=2 Tax=Sinorhizobium medicae TaxID=110321 RepID=A0A6G1WWJ4_9HYPH|nr:aldo/keto reductase [Sinorhizobium medicae]ABR63137.1 aldo/keto reductase [Sinorhizobium medicae WSM419]MBO1942829.1 aldo/keto reductase [Sinorhizobium medicae]MDX0409364.1 aldo/keto reductase [Sinorhizobium medicae]MDX0421461.1 aldo/keto reductase [Sinorhizobium medicae]MDX0427503.1 aldo/keto reductase [Sinorhizobium medicae]